MHYFVSILVFAIISMGKKELVSLLCLSSWCLVIVVWLFLTMPRVCLHFVIVVFPENAYLLFFGINKGHFHIMKMWLTCSDGSLSSYVTVVVLIGRYHIMSLWVFI